MVRKCLIANIPIIASGDATTTLAIRPGEQSGLIILGLSGARRYIQAQKDSRMRNFPDRDFWLQGCYSGFCHT